MTIHAANVRIYEKRTETALLAAVALHAALVLAAGHLPGRAWITGGAYLLGLLTCVLVTAGAARGGHPAQRPLLRRFTLALGALLLGDAITLSFELRGLPIPALGVADTLYGAYYLLMAWGLLKLTRLRLRSLRTIAMILDSLIVMVILGTLCWTFLLTGNVPLHAAGAVYMTLDLALIAVGLLALRQQRLSVPVALICAGLALIVGGDLHYAVLGSYASGDRADFLYLWGTALQALGLWQRREQSVRGVQWRPPRPVRVWLAAFPYLAGGLTCAALLLARPTPVTLWGAALTFLLVLIRQSTVLEENRLLARKLRHSAAELERRGARLRHQARHDTLTGLPNRSEFEDQLRAALSGPAAVMFIDLDGFKDVNDTFGHPVGDELLRLVTARLQAHLPARATLARVGGDEFTLVLPGADERQAMHAARQLLGSLRDPVPLVGLSLQVSASIGVSLAPRDGTDVTTLQRRADTAMYHAKRSGRQQVQLFTPSLDEQRRERLILEAALRRALTGDEFTLHYQPQLRGPHLESVEALLRWTAPDLGTVTPGRFIPVAEQCGLILPLGRWVRERACEQAAAWHRQGRALRVAVNVSPLEFAQPDFVPHVQDLLARLDLPAHLLELEVTEGVLVQDLTGTAAKLRELRAAGVRISVDDFGVQHASLSALMALPADVLKLDRSFLTGPGGGARPPPDRRCCAPCTPWAAN
ncbi:bifunctional diguanylate cyclase/phosphodiesterase [Deinococcus sp. JMULE3]|uniref:putative bifunctional diguanylate cyclase/phosphodiesterase n=1 Tax=Deinococcus sp. JMULE3 TaxID=2518341 RepID=UPI001575C70A|nr:EAL domain-containing protein [Deinococcus sp. JMULE3]NTY00150.1 EAL domain-containing protein [Deinococcus sp. JMULE3]